MLAQDANSYKIVAALKGANSVENKEDTAKKIAGVLGKGEEDILASLNKEGRSQVEFGTLGKDLTKEKKEQIEALKLPGISFITENARVYPNGDFASYVIGHAKPNENGTSVGQFGIEKAWINT